MTRPPTPARLAVLLVFALAPAAQAQDADDAPAEIKAAAAAANKAQTRKSIQTALSKSAGVGRLIRVNSFDAGKDRLEVRGYYFEPVLPADDDKKGEAAEAVLAELTTAVRAALKKDGVKDADDLLVGVGKMTQIDFAAQPHVELQRRAAAAGGAADRLVLTGSAFDQDGAVVVAGRTADEKAGGPVAWLDAEAGKLAAEKGFEWVGGAKNISAAGVTPGAWKLTPADLQKALAADTTKPEAQGRVRIDRAYPAYKTGDRQLELKLTGVWLAGGEREPTEEAVVKATEGAWATTAAGVRALVRTSDLLNPETQVQVGELDPALQKAVAADPDLDGTRVAPGMGFTAAGDLAVPGFRPTFPDAAREAAWKTALARRLSAVAAEKATAAGKRGEGLAKLFDRGVSTERLTVLPSQQILARLRQLAREDDFLEDVLLKRLAFDPAGRLRLDGQYVNDLDRARLAAELRRAVAEHQPVAAAAPPPKADPAKPADEVAAPPAVTIAGDGLVKTAGGLTDHLRKAVAADPKAWHGVVIRRGYFDAGGRYTLAGLVDRAGQNADLDALLETTKLDPRWAAYFAAAPAPAALAVFPMARLLDRVRRVAPGHPVYDGVVFADVTYDADLNLVFDVAVVGSGRTGAAEEHLRGLLAASPDYGRRLPRALVAAEPGTDRGQVVPRRVRFRQSAPAVPPNRTIGSDTAPLAGELFAHYLIPDDAGVVDVRAALRARRLLDVGLLHAPEESALWYLGAYLHLLAGDTELARRDLYRVVGAEGLAVAPDEPVYVRRHLAAAGIQGRPRHALDALMTECRRELQNGRRPLTLDP